MTKRDDYDLDGPADEHDEHESDWNPTLVAAAYARAGMRVFPVDMSTDAEGERVKEPLHGYLWKARATSSVNAVAEDFTDACQRLGIDNVGVAWAVGLDGCLAVDLDQDEPDWWDQLGDTAVNVTKKGRHLIFRQPVGRTISNGTSKFPTTGWGEVRGAGGYIVVAATDRTGFEVDELGKTVEFPMPQWLTDAGPDAEPVDDAALRAFIAAHATGDVRLVKGYRARLDRWTPTESRHQTAVEVACWMAREAAAGLVPARDAFGALRVWWESVVDGRDRRLGRAELDSIVRWAVGVALADPERLARLAGDTADDDALRLPERFWARPRHATVRAAARQVGVSPEALMLAVIIAVAAHIPPVIVFPGKRRGVPNLLAAVVGPPGRGKGTTLDRALELVPPPTGARRHPLGTAQGLVKEFFRPTTKTERDADKDLPTFVRHHSPVIVRTDEVGKFAAAASGDRGADLIATVKQAVFGEGLGQGVATEDKNLRCDPRSYRMVGVLGAAPGVAGPLFDDIDGGLPQRLLFAYLTPPGVEPTAAPDVFVDLDLADVVAPDGAGGYLALDALDWRLPDVDGRQTFADTAKVAARVEVLMGAQWELLDAHVPYLTHAVAAVLACLDGRWTIQPADLTFAADVVEVSRATRAHLLAGLERSAADGRRRRAELRRAEAVDTAEAIERQRLDLQRLDGARRVVAVIRALTADEDSAPTGRDVRRRMRGADEYVAEAERLGWVRVDVEPTVAGGSPRRGLVLTELAP